MSQIYIPRPRPLYVPKDFLGQAKCFPEEDTYFMRHQTDWINDDSLEKIQEKSRRVGVSYATSYERVRNHSLNTTALDTWISSRDEMTARLFVKDCDKFAKPLNAAAKAIGSSIIDDDRGQRNTVHSLAFKNGTMINSVASNADVFAGKGGDVVIDEIALRKQPGYVLGIGLSTTDWGGRMASISTHRGSGNDWNLRVKEVRDGREPVNGMMRGRGKMAHVTLHRTTLEYALESGFLYKLQCKLKANDPRLLLDEQAYFDYMKGRSPSLEIFMQEYCCVPEDDASAFITYAMIDNCTYEAGEDWAVKTRPVGRRFTLGIDIGRDHDLTCIWVLEWIGKTCFTREVVEMGATPFHIQWAELCRLWDFYRPFRAGGDRNGIGRQLCDEAVKKWGRRFEAVAFTQESKADMAWPVRHAMEDSRIKIPRDDAVSADFRSIKKETTSGGNDRFTADRGKNGHADRFWAVALAYAAGTEAKTYRKPKPAGGKGVKRNEQQYRRLAA